MNRLLDLVVSACVVALLLLATACVAPGRVAGGEIQPGAKKAGEQAAPALVGAWTADSVATSLDGGRSQAIAGGNGPANVILSGGTFTLRVRDKILAEMSYVADETKNPCTIDLKSADGAMLGIYRLKGPVLEIGLDDAAKGRPTGFSPKTAAMSLRLRCFDSFSLYVVDADGRNRRQILALPEFTFLGSPKWSPDGRRIALDAWRSVMGEGVSDAHILLVDAAGGTPKDLGPGAMPSWSPDGERFTCCQYGEQYGVWIMNVDGTGRRQLDGNGGWGSKWSNRHDEIAYVTYDSGTANLCIYDVATEKRRTLLDKTYRQIWWGLSWSPDDQWICYKAALPDGRMEVAAVSVAGEKKGFKVLLPNPAGVGVNSTMSWGGPRSQILLSMKAKADLCWRLYLLDFAGGGPPRLFPGIPAEWSVGNAAWSADGKKVAVCAKPVTQ